MNTILAVIGIIGGLLCATADLLLDLKGPKNKKLGQMGVIDSEWANMSHWRFVWSDILAMFAVPMYSCGFIGVMMILHKEHPIIATVLTVVFLVGAMGGFMIHTFLCQQPTIYRKIKAKADLELADDVISSVFKQIYVPFFTLYSMLVIIPAIAVIVLIIAGFIHAPLWCVVLNPFVFQLVGFLFRATKLNIFIDAPSCCAASLGLASYGLLALLCL